MNRHYSLDNLKVLLTFLVIFHHAGMAYCTGGSWLYKPSNPAEVLPWFWHVLAVNAGFFMGLYFMISGFFVPTSYDKQGGKLFVKKKLIRLGIPLVVMGVLLSIRAGRIELSHLWFIESLLLFNLIYALIRVFVKPISAEAVTANTVPGEPISANSATGGPALANTVPGEPISANSAIGGPALANTVPGEPVSGDAVAKQATGAARFFRPTLGFLLLLGAAIGLFSFGIRLFCPQDQWIWPFGIPFPIEPAHYPQYILMFVMGILARRYHWLDQLTDRVGLFSLIAGCLMVIGIWCVSLDKLMQYFTWYGFYESFLCVFLSFGLIWLFSRFFNRTNKFLQWCSAQSYGAYIIHLLLMLEIQRLADGIWMGAFGKMMFIGISTIVISFTLTWLLKKIPGVNKVL
jgi:Uncharacterized protein conserved in bacteria